MADENTINWKTVGVSLLAALLPAAAALAGAARWQGSTDERLKGIDWRLSRIEAFQTIPMVTRIEFDALQRRVEDSERRVDDLRKR